MRILQNFIILVVILFFTGCEEWGENDSKPTLKIGVMLPYSGSYTSNWDNALDWAVENINISGGVAGCNIQLVKKDLGKYDLESVSEEFIADESIKAVIGPLTSHDVFEVAPLFIGAQKVLFSPVATASNISRAFAGKKYFWRLSEPDISQTKTLLLLAKSGGAHSVGLITEDSDYGASFEDWFGYFATELGLEVSGIKVIDSGNEAGCQVAWDGLISKKPDAIISALNQPKMNTAIAKCFRENGQQCRLLFSDAACLPSLIEGVGTLAQNLEGVNLSSDPTSGFDISYKIRYNEYPDAFLANMYDAVMLLSYALQISAGEGGEALTNALMEVVSGQGDQLGWQRDEVSTTLEQLRNGATPNIKGASGKLDYDQLYFTDVTSSTYGHWRVDEGQFVVTDFYTSDGDGRINSTSAAYRTIAHERQQFSHNGNWPTLPSKNDSYAFLMATSRGWDNYRHQADVLHNYQLLKQNGMDDDHIILIMADDLVNSSSNIRPGEIINEPDGENLYQNITIDYKLDQINEEAIKNILTGKISDKTPIVLPSTSSDNVFIFTSGHGSPDGMVLENTENGYNILSPEYWNNVFEEMHMKQNYRQIFWSIESCYSGAIGEKIKTPGVMLMTGANPFETSKAHLYDSKLKVWTANKFAYSINKTISDSPNILFSELYEKAYTYVNGSHVSFYNYQNFGNIYEIPLNDFIQ